MELIYNIKDKPPVSKILLAAIQQLLAVIAGTIVAPLIIGHGMSQSAALFGAGIGTIVYLLITGFKSPVFLGSSFSFIGSMTAAFAGAASMSIGYFGLILGAALAGLLYVILGLIVKFAGSRWVDKLMPPVIIGPVVAVIGLSLAPNAINNLTKGSVLGNDGVPLANPYLCLLCGLIALFTMIIVSVYAKRMLKLVPFIIGIIAGYIVAALFTLIGNLSGNDALKIINFDLFKNIDWIPSFTFLKAIDGIKEFSSASEFWKYFALIAVSYVPVSFACFAEHIADHKNLSFITNHDLLKDPGLHRTLFGDGTGSMVGAFFGGCPNTTYGESLSCTILSKNASTITIFVAALIAIVLSFVGPIMTFFASMPTCIIGGLSIALYGFIAASGFQMLKKVDLGDSRNIFIVASILVVGIGGLVIQVHFVQFSPIATSLVVGILVNLIINIKPKKKKDDKEEPTDISD